MNIRIEDTDSSKDCIVLRDEKSKALIWKSTKFRGLTFLCGDFTIEEVEEILIEMKKEIGKDEY